MVDPVSSARIGYRLGFVLLTGLILFVRSLPLSAAPAAIPGPDLIFCLAAAWVLRRPDYAPVLLVVGIFLVEDLLTMRPPGLWTLIALVGTEFLRSRAVFARDLPFVVEWAMVGVVLGAMTVANRVVLAVLMVPQAGLGPVLLQVVISLLAYPAVVAVSHWAIGLRKAAPGQVDALGHRL
jgi:rod shape-determining protein MreD